MQGRVHWFSAPLRLTTSPPPSSLAVPTPKDPPRDISPVPPPKTPPAPADPPKDITPSAASPPTTGSAKSALPPSDSQWDPSQQYGMPPQPASASSLLHGFLITVGLVLLLLVVVLVVRKFNPVPASSPGRRAMHNSGSRYAPVTTVEMAGTSGGGDMV